MKTQGCVWFQHMALAGVFLLGMAASAYAADPPQTLSSDGGVIEIDQDRAELGGLTSGDSPGFPVTISQPGSYRLTSNLLVPGGANGIEIAADGVTLDLNGFEIAGGSGSGIGITLGGPGPKTELAIHNGTISNMGGGGIDLAGGARCRIENLRLLGASTTGDTAGISVGELCQVKHNVVRRYANCIEAGFNSIVSGNTLEDCINNGILIGSRSILSTNTVGASTSPGGNVGILTRTEAAGVTIRGNTITNQKNGGIVATSGQGMLILENTVRLTTNDVGLKLQPTSGYCNNVLNDNNGGDANPQVSGGIQLCSNVCGFALCP